MHCLCCVQGNPTDLEVPASAVRFLKITYHNGVGEKVNAYMEVKSSTFAVLKGEIEMYLFNQHKQPRCPTRMYWIDEDGDEIDVIHEADYNIFLTSSSRHHMHVSAILGSFDEKTKSIHTPLY